MRPGWIVALFALGALCLAACGRTNGDVARDGPYEVRVTGTDFAWHVQYPGPDRVLDTIDDVLSQQHIRVPADMDITIHLQSTDYIYTFFVPDFKQNQIAVPDMDFAVSFRAPSAGTFPLLGSQMCGYDHPNLLGTIIVESPDQRQSAWIADVAPSRGAE